MIEVMFSKELTTDDVQRFIKLRTLDNCKEYLKVMLDFYFDVLISPEGRKISSENDDDRNIWLQTIFSKGCQFLSLLNGLNFSKGTFQINPIIDFSVLFTIARSVYESLIAFEILFVLPKTEEHQTIVYNLFVAHGLSERLKDLDEEMRSHNPERVKEEQNDIDDCWRAIENTNLYKMLNQQTKTTIKNAFGLKYRYIFKEDNTMEFVKLEKAYNLLNVKVNLFNSIYSFLSLYGHPSYLSLIQFRDAFKNEYRADIEMAKHATQCVLSFMSIYIVDYMKLNSEVKAKYDKMGKLRKFVIGMYEDAMRGEEKFK